MAQIIIPAHDGEVLTCDWSKYDQVSLDGVIDCLDRIHVKPETIMGRVLVQCSCVKQNKYD